MDTFQFMAQNGNQVFYVSEGAWEDRPYTRNRQVSWKTALSVDYLELLRRDSFFPGAIANLQANAQTKVHL